MTDLEEALCNPLLVTDERFDLARKAAAEIRRLTAWLETIESVTDEEIGTRFRTSSHKTEEQMAGKSVIYSMLCVPRNLARAALRGDSHTPAAFAGKEG